jgi:hypothetical protein
MLLNLTDDEIQSIVNYARRNWPRSPIRSPRR